MEDIKPAITALRSTHAAFFVTGEDHIVSVDKIDGSFKILLTGELQALYTSSDGTVHEITSSEQLTSSGAADDLPNIQWIQQPWFKVIDGQDQPIGEELFDYLDSAEQIMQDISEQAAGLPYTIPE
jgi:hypothetical protein